MFIKLLLLLMTNCLSVFFLLWFLLIMNTSVNDFFLPSFVERRTVFLIVARFIALFLEAGIWLFATYSINRWFIGLIGNLGEPKKTATYIFFCEYGFVVALICLFFYNVYWVRW